MRVHDPCYMIDTEKHVVHLYLYVMNSSYYVLLSLLSCVHRHTPVCVIQYPLCVLCTCTVSYVSGFMFYCMMIIVLIILLFLLFLVPNFAFPQMPFSKLVSDSMNACQSLQAWCDKCNKYQPHVSPSLPLIQGLQA